jgi:2-oxoglutarate ferredoxin oxidoreductase subunit alpha
MPTRSQQSDLLTCAYASHGDTKHILLFPATPKECFEFAADSFDLADRIQSPIIVMSDLELGMNDQICDTLNWDDKREYDRGKVLDADQLEEIEKFGRYLDSDDDGIPYRTYPGTHPTKGSYFTRGSSHDAYAAYTEDGNTYAEMMDRLTKKMITAISYLPEPEISETKNKLGMIYLGTTTSAIQETLDSLGKKGISLDTMRIRAFPFHDSVADFINSHELVYVIEQNRDAQLKSLLKIECNANESQMHSILSYNGILITATHIEADILASMPELTITESLPA